MIDGTKHLEPLKIFRQIHWLDYSARASNIEASATSYEFKPEKLISLIRGILLVWNTSCTAGRQGIGGCAVSRVCRFINN